MPDVVRRLLRRIAPWVRFRAVQREGWANALARWRVASRVLATRPVRTGPTDAGPPAACEVHILVCDRDHLAGLWAAKSLYAAAEVDWPLFWHQGGPMSRTAVGRLRQHFPNSRFVDSAAADRAVSAALTGRGLTRCHESRGRAFMLRKLFDPVVVGRADYLLVLDTDVLFFEPPVEVVRAVAQRSPVSLFNRDVGYWYNLTPAAARERYGIDLAPEVNAGLGLVRRAGMDFDLAEQLLADPDIMSTPWLTEQTLQALLASKYGIGLLPPTYGLSTGPGLLTADGARLVAKHYPGHPRPWLYQEGIPHVLRSGLLKG